MTDFSVDTVAVIKHYIKTLYCRKRSLEIRFCLNSEAMPSCNESLSPAKLKAVFVPESVAFSPFHDVIPVKTKPFHYTLKYRIFAIISRTIFSVTAIWQILMPIFWIIFCAVQHEGCINKRFFESSESSVVPHRHVLLE